MTEFLTHLAGELDSLRERGLYRTLAYPAGIDFVSNDYLGLCASPDFANRVKAAIDETPVGAPASRLLRGHTTTHSDLETRLASFKGSEAALLYSSGYQANIGVLSSLIQRRDRVLTDELNHASLIDGLKLTRPSKVIYPHLDTDTINRELKVPYTAGRTFIVTESLFSMDGDIAPLDVYADLADQYGANLIVDDAHATGVFGSNRGSGLVEEFGIAHRAVCIISTFGKALGLSGAFVAGPTTVIDYLINKSRPFVFTTALPPLLLRAVNVSLDIIASEPQRRLRVLDLAQRLRDRLHTLGVAEVGGRGPIVPVVIGDPDHAMHVANTIQARGYDVRAVRPPTVPTGTSRLRISVHANHTTEQIDGLAQEIASSIQMFSYRT